MSADPRRAELREPRMTKRAALAAFLVSAALCVQDAGAVAITQASGKVLFLKNGSYTWAQISAGQVLGTGDQLKTAGDATATVTFDDGSKVDLNPGSAFTMQESSPAASTLQLKLGSLRAWVSKSLNRRFQVRTPTAVCSVRGTEFSVEVGAGGDTRVQMFGGLLAVSDNNKNEVLIKDTQGVEVTAAGLGTVTDSRSPSETQTAAASDAKREAAREVNLRMSKEEVQSMAAEEAKLAEYQSGKVMMDVNGNRVRLEQYIMRPADNQFKLVVLNERSDRFDWFYYLGTFNTVLPNDLSVALRQLPGCIGAACSYFLTGYSTGRSNTIDNMLEVASGGHQVDINNNGQESDDVEAAFDPATDTFVSLAEDQPYFTTLYDNYRLTFNSVEHQSWAGVGITNMVDGQAGAPAFNFTTSLTYDPACAPPNCTYNEFDQGIYHEVFYSENAGGTIWDKFDNYIISDEGKIARHSDFAGTGNSGSAFIQKLLNWNFQTIVTASEFGGRKIDLVVEPKLFIQSGLIP